MEQKQVLDYLRTNKQDISQRYHLTKLGIFGSYARGEQTPKSDLDLLVEFEADAPQQFWNKQKLRTEMQQALQIPVDICSGLKYLHPYFLKHILKDIIYV